MNKEELRKRYLQERRILPQGQVQILSQKISEQLFSSVEFKAGDAVHIFLPIIKQNEINTHIIIKKLEEKGVQVVVPITNFSNKSMTTVTYHSNQATQLNKDIPEPIEQHLFNNESLTHVLVPLAIFDKKGYRVGYGGGFYDRFIPNLNPKVKIIGLSIFKPVDNCFPNKFDISLDSCVTANTFYSF